MFDEPVGFGVGQNPDFADEAAFFVVFERNSFAGLIQQAAHRNETVVFIVDFGEAGDLQFGRVAVHNALGQHARPRKTAFADFQIRQIDSL